MGGKLLRVMTFFGDTAGPLSVSPSGQEVYVGVFKSGNKITIVGELMVCNGGDSAEPCQAISNGEELYVAAMGSSKIGIINANALENSEFTPSAESHITVTGGGPTGLALDDDRQRSYVSTRYDNAVSIIDVSMQKEVAHVLMPNPEPESIISVFVGAPDTPAQADLRAPQLRNAYEKAGMFGNAGNELIGTENTENSGNQIRGFGFMRDGGFDTVQRKFATSIFDTPGGEIQQRKIEQIVFAFDSNLKPVVGQQISLHNNSAEAARARAELLINRSTVGDADLVVSGQVDGLDRKWLLQPDGNFMPGNATESALSEQALPCVRVQPSLCYTATVKAPSIIRLVPEILLAIGLQRKTTPFATSMGVPNLPVGLTFTVESKRSGMSFSMVCQIPPSK